MESKTETDFALTMNFSKTDHYFYYKRNNGSTYPKLTKIFSEG